MPIVSSTELYRQMQAALGLPANVTRMELILESGAAAIVKCWYLPSIDGELAELFQRYELHSRTDGVDQLPAIQDELKQTMAQLDGSSVLTDQQP